MSHGIQPTKSLSFSPYPMRGALLAKGPWSVLAGALTLCQTVPARWGFSYTFTPIIHTQCTHLHAVFTVLALPCTHSTQTLDLVSF